MGGPARRATGVVASFVLAAGLAACLHAPRPGADPVEGTVPAGEGVGPASIPALMRQTEEEAAAREGAKRRRGSRGLTRMNC